MLAAICWTFTKNVQNTLGIPRMKFDLFFMCLHCGFVDILTSGLPRVAGVDGECDAVIGGDDRRCSPCCEILLGPPWW